LTTYVKCNIIIAEGGVAMQEVRYTVDIKEFKKAMVDADFNTYLALSKSSGVSRRTVAAIGSGENKNPAYPIMQKLATALKLDGERAARIFFADRLT
jgi:hypothetical protein